MLDDLEKDAKHKMRTTIDLFINDIKGIRGGRVSASLLDGVQVKVYGGYSKLAHIATVSVVDERSLSIKVWDKSNFAAVKDALLNSELGVTPSVVGDFLMITLPGLTSETRAKLIKMLKKIADATIIALRNIRRDFVAKSKSMSNNGDISEDDSKHFCDLLQKMTDSSIAEVEKFVSEKEREIESI